MVSTMTLLSYLLPVSMILDSVSSQSALLSTSLATPTCLQARQRTNPAASNNVTALSSAVPDACNPSLEKGSINGTCSIENYQVDSFNFNISHIFNITSNATSPPACPDAFNAIIASCVLNVSGAVFWGGWMLQGADNYSISNIEFPANSLARPALCVRESSSGVAGIGQPLSQSTMGFSVSPSLGMSSYHSPSSSAWYKNWQSANVSTSNDGPSPGSNTGAAALIRSSVSSGVVPTSNPSRSGKAPGSRMPTPKSSSTRATTAYGSGGSKSWSDLGGFGIETHSRKRAGSIGSTVSLAVASSDANLGGKTVSSNTFSYSKSSSSPPLAIGQLPTTVRSSVMSANSTSRTETSPAPASNGGSSGPTSTPSSATSSPTLATSLAALSAVLQSSALSPSRINTAPSGTTASSEGVIFGGILFSLSKSIHGIDLTIPTIKARVIQDVENNIKKATDLFRDLGGTDVTDSCGGGSKIKRLSNPFTGLGNLAGDITKIVGCADLVLISLKDNLDKDAPDPDLTDDLLEDLGTLADETDPDDDPPKSVSEGIASHKTSAHVKSSPSSGASSSASSRSSSSSSSDSGCTRCCPPNVPTLPTDGIPAVTAAPTDFDTLDKRVVPERFQRMAKRRPDVPLPKINRCILRTPNDWPVTTPAYPGGWEFWSSETAGVLGTLTTVSRYYRSTTFGAPACTPTITRINAGQWTFPRSGLNVPENDKISIDHAYEIGFLKSFMESIIDQPNGVTCSNANAQFFDRGKCADNRLQPIFGSLPSYANPDFIAMSQWLNGDAKGWVLGPTFDPRLGGALTSVDQVDPFDSWQQATQKITNKMALAQILVGAALIINADNTVAQMQKTNNRIYAAFQTFDTYLRQHPRLPQSNFGWASHYKTYMDKYVNYRNGASARLLPGLLANIGTDLRIANNNAGKVQYTWDQWNNLYNSMRTYYGAQGNGAGDINWAINWEWNVNNVKRSEIDKVMEKRQACLRPSSPSGGIDTTATGSTISAPKEGSTFSAVIGRGSDIHSTSSALSSQAASSSTAPTPIAAFSCTTIPDPPNPYFPCHCSDGYNYCDTSGPCESITSPPVGENCCMDCD